MQSGVVFKINARRGMVAVRTEDNDFTIVELLEECDLAIGHVLEWAESTGLGEQVYKNLTTGRRIRFYVQNHWVKLRQLDQQLLM